MNENLEKIIKYILPAITFVLGLIAEYCFYLFKNKIPKIRYSISKSLVGMTKNDAIFGSVKVLYHEVLVENIYFCNIFLVNTSNQDFKDLELVLWSDQESTLLSSTAAKTNTISILELTEKYINKLSAATPQERINIWKTRPYSVPVFNRDETINVSCLVTNEKGKEPNVYLDCNHPGLKIEANFVKPELFWGEDKGISSLWGLVASGIILIPILYYIPSKITVTIIAFFLGGLCILPGVLVIKAFKLLKKILR